MNVRNKKQDVFQFIQKTGYDIDETMLENIDLHYQKGFDFLPELTLFFASYRVKESFSRSVKAPSGIKDCLCFFFRNLFDDQQAMGREKSGLNTPKPVVRVFPSSHSYTSYFKKGTDKKMLTIFISAEYLKSFLKEDAQKFQFLFNTDHIFMIEEIMTDDILHTVKAIVRKEESGLENYYYKLKAMELLYYLFQSLEHRRSAHHQSLREKDIHSIYKVRDKLVASLDRPTPIAELQNIAGMNATKMRRIFTQIFGRGIYDYFQYFRMKEAARLLREEQLLVSEVGYQMGFENLSHFSRVFKKYCGQNPKHYSMTFR